jgi:hypothetical protein
MSIADSLRNYISGAQIIASWDGQVVTSEIAQRRSEICRQCPLNRPGSYLSELTARAVKCRMEAKLGRKLFIEGHQHLRTCHACDCYIPVKIWYPLVSVYPTEEQKPMFWKQCWLLNESI